MEHLGHIKLNKKTLTIIGAGVALVLIYYWWQSRQAGASGTSSGAAGGSSGTIGTTGGTAGADYAALSGNEQADIANVEGEIQNLDGELSALGSQPAAVAGTAPPSTAVTSSTAASPVSVAAGQHHQRSGKSTRPHKSGRRNGGAVRTRTHHAPHPTSSGGLSHVHWNAIFNEGFGSGYKARHHRGTVVHAPSPASLGVSRSLWNQIFNMGYRRGYAG